MFILAQVITDPDMKFTFTCLVIFVYRVEAHGRAGTQNGSGRNGTKGTAERRGGNSNSRAGGQSQLLRETLWAFGVILIVVVVVVVLVVVVVVVVVVIVIVLLGWYDSLNI